MFPSNAPTLAAASPAISPADSADVHHAVHALQARADPLAPLTPAEGMALETLYLRFGAMMRATARRFLTTEADADDVVQDVALRLPSLLAQYRHGGLASWLRRVVVNAALMRIRRTRREFPLDGVDLAHEELADEVLERLDLARRALASLPRSMREVVVLRMFLDYTHEDIARRLGITVTASEIRLHRALKLLRTRYGPPRGGSALRPKRRGSHPVAIPC